jgi:hypothetical protein
MSTKSTQSDWIGRSGGCQCGDIRYRLEAEPLTLYACHCRHCQKQSSSAFGMSLWVPLAAIVFVRGKPETWTTRGDSGGLKDCAFCDHCGSRIYHGFGEGPVSLKPGSLDDTSDLRPVAHIWTRRAQPWLDLASTGVPCYPGEPDDDAELLRLWRRGSR